MNLNEIEAKIAELEAMKLEVLQRDEEKKAQEKFDEAVTLVPELVSLVRRLDELGYLPQRLVKALTDEHGKVNPGMYLKRPRAIVRPHFEESEHEQPTREPHAAPRKPGRRNQAEA
ncbi:hypothetical protein [Rhizobium sp. Leaf383]|uniref:hypothetical protein n=1 Tax=Rhizobium sp. Leaf383 TaxID=1736357 RepID=UPI00138F1174|nr:hypothetical protein [Rhizobium sp. Leaf383]